MDEMDNIYQEYANTVYKFLLSQTHNEDLSEELTQETFYQAMRSIDRFDGSCKMSVWLCQIAKHMWYRHLEKHRHEATDGERIPEEAGPSAEDETIAAERQMELLQRIHALPELTREVVYLRALGGLSFREIGCVMGRTDTWARVTFYRGKEKMRGGFEDE